MTKVRGRFIDGIIVLEGPPPDWEDGLDLVIQPSRNGTANSEEDIDEPEETPEQIEAWIREFLAIPPLVFSAEEQVRFDEWQLNHKKSEIEIVAKEFRSGVFYT